MFDNYSLIGTIVIGLLIGVIAKFLMPGKDPGGCLITILIGLAGSFVGGLIGRALFGTGYAPGWIVSILGAMLLLFIYRKMVGGKGPPLE